MMREIIVVGAGLAGCEAAYYLAEKGFKVKLYEKKSFSKNEAQGTDLLAELVCSNSLRGKDISQGVGLLKKELQILDSLFMEAAIKSQVPAGGALAVDRNEFSGYITDKIRNHKNIILMETEFDKIYDDEMCIVATGPLTEGPVLKQLERVVGREFCYFYDGSAPIVSAESIDMDKVFFASRYDKGNPTDYLNAPMNKEEYERFYQKLISSEKNIPHLEGEKEKYFEGCMPIEAMAKRGEKTLLFGPLKPVGLSADGSKHHAVVQLRAENAERTMYNLVGCQTGLTFPEQKKLIQLIPGLENAEILRYGVVHRNTFINSPKVLSMNGSLKSHENIFIAGQLSGVEGYVESAASGLFCAMQAARKMEMKDYLEFPEETMIASLMRYISTDIGERKLEPMNANFGLLPPLEEKIRDKKLKKETMANRSLEKLEAFKKEFLHGRS